MHKPLPNTLYIFLVFMIRNNNNDSKARFFLLADLREKNFRSRVGGGGGRKTINKKL